MGGALNFAPIHDSANVIHPLIHGRQIGYAVGEAGATLVEKHDTAKASKLAQPPRKTRIVPIVFDVGDESGRHNEVGTFAKYLIGDVYFTALGVMRGRLHDGSPPFPSRCVIYLTSETGRHRDNVPN